MNFVLQPWHLLLTILAGLINRQQQDVVEYLRTENQVLKETHGKRRIRLNNRLIEPVREVGRTAGRIQCRKRLGGMLRYYYNAAA